MRLAIGIAILSALIVGVTVEAMPVGVESALKGEYEWAPLRMITVINAGSPDAIAVPLKAWADKNGYKFRLTPMTGEPGSLLFEIWNDYFVISGDPRLNQPGFVFNIYLNSDNVDQTVLNTLADNLRAILIHFGPVEISAAAPGTPPRLDPKTHRRPNT